MKIALTGGIACGKSTLAKFLTELGICLLDADDVVHELEGPGGAAVGPILDRFPTVAGDDGIIKNEELRIKNCHAEGGRDTQHRHCEGRNASNDDVCTQHRHCEGRGTSPVAISCATSAELPVNRQSVDRKKLAQIVFNDPAARKDLENILFPMVRERLRAFADGGEHCGMLRGTPPNPRDNSTTEPINQLTNHQSPTTTQQFLILNSEFKISVIPLLFESHWESDYDIILAIASPEEMQINRMMVTRGYTREHAKARLAAQMPIAEKIRRADYVITNDSTPEHLRDEAGRLLAWLKERKKYEH